MIDQDKIDLIASKCVKDGPATKAMVKAAIVEALAIQSAVPSNTEASAQAASTDRVVAWELHSPVGGELEGRESPEVRLVFSSRMADEYIEEGWKLERELRSDKRTANYARGYDQVVEAGAAPANRPSHETIVREGDSLVCTVCGTSVDAASDDVRDAALKKVNAIRNSIIGLQALNWSEHVYPLVAALDEAGYDGMPYPEARANVGTLLERAVKAEDELATMRTTSTPADDSQKGGA